MVIGMATRKVTVTLDEAQLERVRSLVESGAATSVSGFVQHAVGAALAEGAGWEALLAEALAATGGVLTEEERSWADGILGHEPVSGDTVEAHPAERHSDRGTSAA